MERRTVAAVASVGLVMTLGAAVPGRSFCPMTTFRAIAAAQAAPPYRPAVRAGNFVYLSGALPMDASGKVVSADIKAQTRQALDNLKATLAQEGLALDRAASVTVYLKHASDFAAMNEVYATYWPANPPVRTTVEANLVVPDALVEISLIALANGAERTIVLPAGWVKSPSPYSYGIKSGDTLFLAGLVARNAKDNTTVKGDIAAQTHATMANADAILKAAGMTFADVVSARVYLTDIANFEAMNTAYRGYFPKDPPARATARTGLTSADYLIEITFTAVAGKDRAAIVTPNADGTPGRPNPNLSAAIRVGNRLFLSGALGNTDANATDVGAQTREALTRLGRTLTAAGFDWSDVVDASVYLSDATRAAAMNDAYRQVLTKGFPARATFEAGLVSPTALVEIMMTAARKGK